MQRLNAKRRRGRGLRGLAHGGAVALALVLAGCATLPVLAPPPPEPFVTRPLKPVVAVTSFDNRSGFDGQWSIGDGLADLLVMELKRSGRLEVLERQNLDRVMGELMLQNGPHVRREGKVAAGQLKNCRFQVRGVIDDFTHVGGGAFFVVLRRLLFFGRGYEARVSLSLTVVDVETGVILAAVPCAGRASAREAGIEVEYKNVRFGGEAFYKTPLGGATRKAIRAGVRRLLQDIPVQYWQPMIAATGEDGVYILNGGAREGFEMGRLYRVRASGAPVTDPATGDLLAWLPGPEIGTLRVTDVREKISLAVPVAGGGFTRGQALEPLEPEGPKAP